MEFFNSIWNSPSRYVLILMAVIMVVYVPFMYMYMKKKKAQAADFHAAHPNAAKVYITGVMQGSLTVLSVNDDVPNNFYEGTKQGFFLLPGANVIEVQYTWSKPGIVHKTVTTTVGPNKIKVEAEPYKVYTINYDKSEEQYIFREENR